MAIYENEIFEGAYQPPAETKKELKKIGSSIENQYQAFLEVFPWTSTKVTVENFESYFVFKLIAEFDDDEGVTYHPFELPEDQSKVDEFMSNYSDHLDSWRGLLNLLDLNSEQSEEVFEDIWPEIASEMIAVDLTKSVSRSKTYAALHVYEADPYRFIHFISPALLLNDFEILIRSNDEAEYVNAVFIREVEETENDPIKYLESILDRRPLRPSRPTH